jgi:tetratricopeptide (TPR) repeat protein
MSKLAIIKEEEFMKTETRALADELLADSDFNGARDLLNESLKALPSDDVDERLAILNLLCKVERASGNLNEALRIHLESYPLAQLTTRHFLKWKFHNGLGITYRRLGNPDRALIEYEAVRFHAEEAGNAEDLGYAIVNIAMVLCELNRTDEARAHLEQGRALFAQDRVVLAQLNETEAQVYLNEEKPLEALALAVDAIQTFIAEGQKKLLNDAIPTLVKAAADYRCS